MTQDNERECWRDDRGREWPVPKPGPLSFATRRSHAALRRFVFVRDAFTCQRCGRRPDRVPGNDWAGRSTAELLARAGWRLVHGQYQDIEWPVLITFEVDHVVPRVCGGSNHPDNLRVLCSTCNQSKGAKAEPSSDHVVGP